MVDREGLARAALDALRERPAAWGGRPVFLYGFDDLTPLQRDAVETLARHAEVCVALAYEPGRAAFAGRAATVELLKPLADRHELLADRSEHYAPAARAALHHLERGLFEPGAGRVTPNGAVRLLEAGGERAEAELVAAEVLELTGAGMLPDDIAVLVRGGAAEAEVPAQVLEDYGVPVSLDRRIPFARTRLGAGVLAAARAALPGGTATDLLTWLRTPGRLTDRRHRRPARDPHPPSRARVRGRGARHARPARRAGLGGRRSTGRAGSGRRTTRRTPAGRPARSRARRGTRCVRGAPRGARQARGRGLGRSGRVPGCDRGGGGLDLDRSAPAGGGRARPGRGRRRPRRRRAARRRRRAARPGGSRPGARRLAVRHPRRARRRAGARARRAGRGAGRRPARDPCPPLPRRLRLRPPGGRVPSAPGPRAVSRRLRARQPRPCQRARAAAPRGRARARAVPAVRGGLAARGGPVPLLPLVRRGGRPGAPLGVRGRRPRAVHRRAVGAARAAAAGGRHVAARRRAHAARAAPGPRRRRGPPGAAAARRAHDRARARCPRRARDRGRPRAGDLRRLRRPLARRQRAAAGARRAGSGADAPRIDRPRRARADAPAPAGARRLRPPHAGLAPRRARGARRRDGGAARRGCRHARPCALARARGRSAAAARPRGRVRRRARAEPARVELRPRGRRAWSATARRHRPRCHRPGRPDRRRPRRPRAGARLQGPEGQRRRALGAGQQAPGRPLRARGARAARPRDGRRAVPAGRPPRRPPARRWCAATCRAAT